MPFLMGVGAGLFVLFFFKPTAPTIYEYPHPDNADTRIYRDKNGMCYKYKATEVNCDENEATLKQYPVQS